MERPTVAGDEIERLRRSLARTERELNATRAKLQRDLKLAADVHRSLLPQPVRGERLDVDVRYISVEEVGGDYCQVGFSDQDTCYITICDVMGHGIGPGLLATRVSSEVRHGILYGRKPREIVRSLNEFVYSHFAETGLYLSFVAVQINVQSRRVTWSGAGHPYPLLIRRDGTPIERLTSQNTVIGVLEDCLADRPEGTVDLNPGDRLLLYTDGLTETADADGHYVGADGLAHIAAEAMSVDLFDVADYVLDRIARHQHGAAMDDKTLIVAEIK